MTLRFAPLLPRALSALALAAFACGFAAVSSAALPCPCYAERTQCLADATTPTEERICRLEFDRCMKRACPAPPSR